MEWLMFYILVNLDFSKIYVKCKMDVKLMMMMMMMMIML